ncbi:MAG: Hsp20/alpha crystallin family protein [Verrucomicrobia bacterium]|nr:Hsp20/alpha crystallin family protein [Verrucomicrobiota bacterium]
MSMVQQGEKNVTRSEPDNQAHYYVAPLVDIQSTPDGYELRAEMPGVNKEGIEIMVDNGQLTLVGHRQPLQVRGERIYRERREHDYRRVYELDPSIDTTRISAKIDQGVLTVLLPKAESVKPRRITLS